jgi:hypothetical protein
MGKLSALRPEVVIAVLLVLTVGSAAADDVTRLRMNKVTLYVCTEDDERKLEKAAPGQPEFAKKQRDEVRTDAPLKWPILAGPSKAGRLTVQVDGELYCVRAYAVQTNVTINAGADCATMVAAAQPRSGATRGLGNDGKGNNHCRPKDK